MEGLPDFPPELLEEFEPLRLLGSGAFAHVFLARDRALDRDVAVKVLQRSGEGDVGKRFLREASTLASLRSENVVEVYDHGVHGTTAYLIMEYLEGETLAARPPEKDVRAVMTGLGRGLLRVHEAGLVHRDLKPENVLRSRDGRVVLADFGLVSGPSDRTRLTREGVRVGTAMYMAPEVLRGEEASQGADWFAWGVMLHQLLTGDAPHTIEDIFQVSRGGDFPEPDLDRLPPDCIERGLLARTLSANPRARALTAAELDLLEAAGRSATETLQIAPPARASDSGAHLARQTLPSEVSEPRPPSRGPLAVLALLLACGLGGTMLGTAPEPAARPAPIAAPGAEEWARVEKALDKLLERHRLPGGGLDESLRGGSYADHVLELVEDYRDPRYPIRWQRLLEGLADWGAAARPEDLEERLEATLVPALGHLARDRGMIKGILILAGLPGGGAFVGHRRLEDGETEAVRSRSLELKRVMERQAPRIPFVAEPPGREALILRGLLGANFVGERVKPEIERFRRAAEAEADPRHAMRLWNTGMIFLPGALDGQHVECAFRVDFYLAALEAFQARAEKLSPAYRVAWAAYAAYHWYTVLGDCGPEAMDGPGEAASRRLLEDLLDRIEREYRENPASVIQYLKWCVAYQEALGLLNGLKLDPEGLGPRLSRLLRAAEELREKGKG